MANAPAIIADAARGTARPIFWIVLALCGIGGSLAAIHYQAVGLTLSHYDARAHLVVARRVFDSLTPGWRQLGGLWLPLPHLLNVMPIAWDANYRTGASAVLISIASLSWGLATFATYLQRRTGSTSAAIAAPAILLANPNVLYLQSTPMTEPLLIGLSLGALAAVDSWIERPRVAAGRRAGWLLAGLVLTRYEGWFVAAGLVTIAAASAMSPSSRSIERRREMRASVGFLAYPLAALLAFLVLSWASTGRIFVTSGFYTADNPAGHDLAGALHQVLSGAYHLAGVVLAAGAMAGAVALLARAIAARSIAALLPAALALPAILPVGAFDAGHPFRIRYMVPLVAASAAYAGFAIAAVPRRVRAIVAAGFAIAVLITRPPLDVKAPMVVEAQRESSTREARQAVTRYLATAYDGTPILASMDSLGHYMQETSAIGLSLRSFLHEGNGDLWIDAFASPKRHVRWVLIEEWAEGGDVLAQRMRSDPAFLDGFVRVAEGGGAALYEIRR